METEEKCELCERRSEKWLCFTVLGVFTSLFLIVAISCLIDQILDYKVKVLLIENATGVCNNVIDLFKDKR